MKFCPYRLQNFGKSGVTFVTPYSDQFWKIKILILVILGYIKVMINHRGGILNFCQNLNFGENRKIEILSPSSNSNFESLTLNSNFRFWPNLDFYSI